MSAKELEKVPKAWPKDIYMIVPSFKLVMVQFKSHVTDIKHKLLDFASTVAEVVQTENDMRSQIEAFRSSVRNDHQDLEAFMALRSIYRQKVD